MGKDGRACSFTRARGAALGLVAGGFLAGCVAAAPPVPGDSTANPVLQHSVSNTILVLDTLYSDTCVQRKIVNTQITEVRPDGHAMEERWTLDRCGERIAYDVRYAPSSRTGLEYGVRREQ